MDDRPVAIAGDLGRCLGLPRALDGFVIFWTRPNVHEPRLLADRFGFCMPFYQSDESAFFAVWAKHASERIVKQE